MRQGASDSQFRVTGRLVLVAVLSFFALIIMVNGIFIYYATKTFSGLETENAYLKGLSYNQELGRKDLQTELDWTAVLGHQWALQEKTLTVSVKLTGADGRPVTALALDGLLRHPGDTDRDRPFQFRETGIGSYTARIEGVDVGQWDVVIATPETSKWPFKAKKRLWLR